MSSGVADSHSQFFYNQKQVFLERDIYYKGLLDNGNSEEVLSLIESTTPANSESRKGQLLSYSPYLSKAAALAVAGQQHFTSSQKKDILAANPELLYRDAVWNAILADSSFSQQQLSELEQARATSTSRDSLERERAEAYAPLHRSGNQLIRYYQNDTAGVVLDTLQNLLAAKLSLEAAYQKADAFLQAQDTASALQELAAIPEKFGLSPDQLKEHGDYTQIKQLQAALAASGQTWQDITEPEKSMLQAVSNNGLGRAAVQAENILMSVDGGNKYYRTPIITAEEQLRAQPPISQEESTGLSAQRMLEAFPNPAREIVYFQYRIPEGNEGAALSLFSSAGQRLATFRLADSSGQLSWKANTLPPGQYYYQLLLPNGQSETGKFIMLK